MCVSLDRRYLSPGALKFVVPKVGGAPRSYCHWWNFDKNANALGVTSSNYAKILLGD